MSSCLRKVHSRVTASVCFFCNSIHPLLTSLNADLTLGYLDELTLGGNKQTVVSDIHSVMETGGKLGLHLNPSKCECEVTSHAVLYTEAVHSHKHTKMRSSYSSLDWVVTLGPFHCV